MNERLTIALPRINFAVARAATVPSFRIASASPSKSVFSTRSGKQEASDQKKK